MSVETFRIFLNGVFFLERNVTPLPIVFEISPDGYMKPDMKYKRSPHGCFKLIIFFKMNRRQDKYSYKTPVHVNRVFFLLSGGVLHNLDNKGSTIRYKLRSKQFTYQCEYICGSLKTLTKNRTKV